jgi:hypothetical protein
VENQNNAAGLFVNRAIVENLVPPGLVGVVREKAIDAMRLSIGVLHMSLDDVQQRVREIAREHQLPYDSPKVWLKFSREIDKKLEMHDPVEDIADKLQPSDRARFRASVQMSRDKLGYSRDDVRARLESAQIDNPGDPTAAARAFAKSVSVEVGNNANSVSGTNGVMSYDQMVTGWGQSDRSGVGDVGGRLSGALSWGQTDNDLDGADERDGTVPSHEQDEHIEMIAAREAERDKAEMDVDTIHRKAATYLNDRNYVGFRTFLENAELLDNKGRGKAEKNRDDGEPARITPLLRNNLYLSSDASARGAIPDIIQQIRDLQSLPEPKELTREAQKRIETPLPDLVKDFGEGKAARSEIRAARRAERGKQQGEQQSLGF